MEALRIGPNKDVHVWKDVHVLRNPSMQISLVKRGQKMSSRKTPKCFAKCHVIRYTETTSFSEALQGSKLTGAQGPLAPGFSKWPLGFWGRGPRGPQNFRTSYIWIYMFGPRDLSLAPRFLKSGGPSSPRKKNRVSSPVI